MAPRPIRVAIVNDYEIVVAGVAAALAPFNDRVKVVELDSGVPLLSDVDVVLYDTFGALQGDGADFETYADHPSAKIVIFSWNTQPELVERSLARGAAGYVAKSLTGAEIVEVIERVYAGEVVRPDPPPGRAEAGAGSWPGREHGLTAREAEILALITQGMSNQEIAGRAFLSINSVKTYIRTAYRKIGVTRRAQAVVWGMNHGMSPDRVRSVRTD